MSSHPERPRDPNQLAKSIIDIATGHGVSELQAGISIRGAPVHDREGAFCRLMWRGGGVDTIFGFEKEADAPQWIKEKSQAWLIDQK
jgi:hypothetical protein